MTKLKIALAQVNLVVGDIHGNVHKIITTSVHARDELKADAIVFSELSITAYPPEDLLFRAEFIQQAARSVQTIATETVGIQVILGFPEQGEQGKLYNSAAVLHDGEIQTIYRKNVLPNYGVFDEKRYFTEGCESCIFEIKGIAAGLTICEDIWAPGTVERTRQAGAQLIVNLNASPFQADKMYERERVVRKRVKTAEIPVVYVNQVGGQDELIFDGASFVMNSQGEVVFRAAEFSEQIGLVEFICGDKLQPVMTSCAPHYSKVSSEYQALVLGVRDYVSKNGFQGAVLGLSGGIDSALTGTYRVKLLNGREVDVMPVMHLYRSQLDSLLYKLYASSPDDDDDFSDISVMLYINKESILKYIYDFLFELFSCSNWYYKKVLFSYTINIIFTSKIL